MNKYGYIGIETFLNFCKNLKDHVVTTNDFMRMNKVRVTERKKGKWVWDGVLWRCSNCNEPFYFVDKTPVDVGFCYCPNCGKGMKLKETDCDYERVYERVVDQLECDTPCESTFNQDDVLVNRPTEPYRGDENGRSCL